VPRWLRSLGAFGYDFVIGDDWLLPLTVLIGLAATWGLVHAGLPAWWPLPVAVAVILPVSLWRAVRGARHPD